MNFRIFDTFSYVLLRLQLFITSLKIQSARSQHKRIVFLFGTPTHRNIGDLAISWAVNDFIKKRIPDSSTFNIPLHLVLLSNDQMWARLIQQSDILAGLGGGNMGEIYLREELCRRKIMQMFPKNKIIIFPQTLHFTDSPTGKTELEKTRKIYLGHKNLSLIAREQHSYDAMKQEFKGADVILTPDIVLSTNASIEKHPRNGLLICLRNDLEAKIDSGDKRTIEDISKRLFETVRHTDTISTAKFFPVRSKNKVVQSKLNEFKSAELVITDRLHGMVFSAITGTPCIALASFNHKVTNTYRWLNKLPYIKFCNDTADLESIIAELDLRKRYEYDPEQFGKFWKQIINKIVASGR